MPSQLPFDRLLFVQTAHKIGCALPLGVRSLCICSRMHLLRMLAIILSSPNCPITVKNRVKPEKWLIKPSLRADRTSIYGVFCQISVDFFVPSENWHRTCFVTVERQACKALFFQQGEVQAITRTAATT